MSKFSKEKQPKKKPRLGKKFREEYFDASSNMRHYGNMRFAELTLFSALTAALLTASVSDAVSGKLEMIVPIRLGGFIISIAFLIMQERSTKQFLNYENRARELEEGLGYQQHRARLARGLGKYEFLSAQNTTRALYGVAAVFWATSIAFPVVRLITILQTP